MKKSSVVIYIASASRSGSTLLDMTLGNLKRACNVGEMRRLRLFASVSKEAAKDTDNRVTCTCGQLIPDCNFWQNIQEKSGLKLSKISFSSEAKPIVRRLLLISFFLLGPTGVRIMAKIYRPFSAELDIGKRSFEIYETIEELYDARIIIDSSKMIYHYVILKTIAPDRVKLIALVRDGRAVAKSMIKRQRKNDFTGISGTYFEQAVRAWRLTNLLILIVFLRTSSKDRYFLRYEEFCQSFQGKVREIIEIFSLPTELVLLRSRSENYHNIGGSPSRFSFKAGKIKLDDFWRQNITLKEKKQFKKYGGWLNKILGYDT